MIFFDLVYWIFYFTKSFLILYFKKILKISKSFRAIQFLHLDQPIQTYLSKKMVKKKKFDPIIFHYEPVSYNSFLLLDERIKTRLSEVGYGDCTLYYKIDIIIKKMKRILEHADKSCCGYIRANGYFSFARLTHKYLECLDQELQSELSSNKLKKIVDSFDVLIGLTVTMCSTVYQIVEDTDLDDESKLQNLEQELLKYPEFHKDLKMFRQVMTTRHIQLNDPVNNNKLMNNHQVNGDINLNRSLSSSKSSFNELANGQEFNSLPLFSPHLDTINTGVYEAIAQPNTLHKDAIYRDRFMIWLDKGLISFFSFYIFVLPFLRVRTYKYPHLIFSEKFRAQILNKIISYPTLNFPFEFWNFSDLKVSLLFVKYKTRNTKTKSREIRIPTQNSIIINQCHINRLKFNDLNKINFNKETLRCKYIKPKNTDIEDCEKLIIHYHGGGFFSQSCDSHEIYLRYWVDNYEIPIITVDYRVKRAFPAGLQDCFDVYVWLRKASEKEIREKLGFYPKKIVIVGDSAGGNLGFGVSLVLNDLRTDYRSKFNVSIKMPDGLVLIYSPFLINTSISGSRVLSSLDTLVPLGVQLVILYGISNLIPGLKPNDSFQALRTYLFPFRDPPSWFDCSENEFKDKCTFLAKNITSPYLTPLFYEKYDQFVDVPMHLISAEYCSFLDESITLAKFWKGPIKVDVLPNLCHGFLNLKFVGKYVSNASMFCGEKVKEMFD